MLEQYLVLWLWQDKNKLCRRNNHFGTRSRPWSSSHDFVNGCCDSGGFRWCRGILADRMRVFTNGLYTHIADEHTTIYFEKNGARGLTSVAGAASVCGCAARVWSRAAPVCCNAAPKLVRAVPKAKADWKRAIVSLGSCSVRCTVVGGLCL